MAGTDRGLPELTPYLSTLADSLVAPVRQLLSLPESVPLAVEQQRAEPSTVRAVIGEGAHALTVDIRAGKRSGWFSGERFSVVYSRFADGGDPAEDPHLRPLLRGLRRRFTTFDAQDDGPWTELAARMEEVGAFAEVRDDMYREVTPRHALIRLGFRCNQKCEFCWQSRSWPEPPSEYYYRWLEEIAAAGYDRIGFSGGEPTIHRDFVPLVRRAHELGLTVDLQTNAIRFAKPGFAAEIAEAGVDSALISYHSHLPEISDEMTRAPRTHERTQRGIAAALEAGMSVHLNCVVEQRNYRDLGAFAEHIVQEYVHGFPDNPVEGVELSHPCNYYERDAWQRRLVPLDEAGPHVVEASRTLRNADVRVNGIGTCGFPPCLLRDDETSLRTFCRTGEAESDVSGRVFAPACEQCAFRPHCLGVRREYLQVYGDRGLRPFERVPAGVVDYDVARFL